MESEEIKNLIAQAKNICLIPSQSHQSESLPATLAFFYALKTLNKNVTLIMQDLESLSAPGAPYQFLVPSLDYLSSPKNFVISIPRAVADVSQVYYEKNEEHLKIHLTVDKGAIKKEAISFYFSDPKPDIAITIGIQDFERELQQNLDSFGMLLDVSLVNIDNHQDNKKFGKVNLVETGSLAEVSLEIIKSLDQNALTARAADCLMAGLTTYYNNFQHPSVPAHIFELCAYLIKKGANRQTVIENLYPQTSPSLPIVPDFSNKKEELVN